MSFISTLAVFNFTAFNFTAFNLTAFNLITFNLTTFNFIVCNLAAFYPTNYIIFDFTALFDLAIFAIFILNTCLFSFIADLIITAAIVLIVIYKGLWHIFSTKTTILKYNYLYLIRYLFLFVFGEGGNGIKYI